MRATNILLTIALAGGLAACNGDNTYEGRQTGQAGQQDQQQQAQQQNQQDQQNQQQGAAAGTVKVADLAENPNRYIGQTVTVRGDVDEVFGPNAFKLDEGAPLRGGIDNDLLVVTRKQDATKIEENWRDNEVQVTGKVHAVAVTEIEREIGWDLNPEIEAELEGVGLVLVADSVQRNQQENQQPQSQ